MLVFVLLLFIEVFFGSSLYHLEKGDFSITFKRFLEGKATETDKALIKAIASSIDVEVPEYLKYYAQGLLMEKEGKLKEALRAYLRSIEIKSDYNPSYFRFNYLIRKVEDPVPFRKKISRIIWNRFKDAPPVIVENPESKYVFLVEKMSQYMMIYRGKKLEGIYPVTTGKDWLDKFREGDKRTPEGIYFFTEFIPPEKLPKIYGGIAVVLNYPNPVDRILGKGGSGIWLHGSDQEDRYNIPFSTRGCVVAKNEDLRVITRKIHPMNTLIAIYKEIPKDIELDDVGSFLRVWKESWENKDLDRYFSLYSKKFTWKGGGIREWKNYKSRAIASKSYIRVKIEDLTVVAFRRDHSREPEYYVAEFTQTYISDKYADRGVKKLYIMKEKEGLRIVNERIDNVVALKPEEIERETLIPTEPSEEEMEEIKLFLKLWEKSWESKDLETFFSLYSRNFTWKRGGFKEWRNYKKRVIRSKRIIQVDIYDVTVTAYKRSKLSPKADLYVVEFIQEYKSDTYSDEGIKRLYIVRENDTLKIVKEEFERGY